MVKGTSESAHGFSAFLDCLELHKLTVFSADGAKRQTYYIQLAICKPQRATLPQFIPFMEVLNEYLKVLPVLKNSPKAVATTKNGNFPFGEADLASILLATVLILWQNQYSITPLWCPSLHIN